MHPDAIAPEPPSSRPLGIAALVCAVAAPCFGPLLLVAPLLALAALRAGRRERAHTGDDPARPLARAALAVTLVQVIAYALYAWVVVEGLV